MTVSAIIPAYNVEGWITRAIDSALAQTHPVHEIIVADDCSTDRTREVVRAIADPRVKLVEMPVNGGPSPARNAAIKAATGEWVALLDADDAWKPERLETLLKYDRFDWIADNQVFYDATADKEGRSPNLGSAPLIEMTVENLCESEIMREFGGSSEFVFGDFKALMRRSIFDKVQYRENLRWGEDTIAYLEMLMAGAKAVVVNQPLYIYTTRFGEVSGARSPSSRSEPDFDGLLQVSHELQARYWPMLDDGSRQAMWRRTHQIEVLKADQDARIARKRGDYAGFAAKLLSNRALLSFFMRRTAHKVWRKVA